jgi:biotin carboxylase
VPGIRAAQVARLKVAAVDGVSDAPGLLLADRSLVVDIRKPGQVIDAIEAADIHPAGAIAFCNEAGMLTAAALREHFGLPGAGLEVVRALTDKGVQRRLWSKAGLPCPLWFVVDSIDEVPQVIESIQGASIFKPVDSSGSRGITVVKEGQPWNDAFAAAMQASLSKNVIIERFVVGVEHTIETFTHRGFTHILAVTSKRKVPGTNDTVAYELASARLTKEKYKEVGEICGRALAALGYTDGPGHTEFLLTENGTIYLVESAGRGGGFMVADGLVPGVSGFDLATACALQAVSAECPLPSPTPPRAAVLRFVPSRPGKVVSIEGFSNDDNVSGVQSEPMVTIGQQVGIAASDGDRMAFVIAVADTVDEALRLTDDRESRIKITLA